MTLCIIPYQKKGKMMILLLAYFFLCISEQSLAGAASDSLQLVKGKLEANFLLRSGTGCDLQRLAGAGDCAFYPCAENVLQCQQRGHTTLSSFGGQFCTSLRQAKGHSSAMGATWIDHLMTCLTTRLMRHLRSAAKSCASIHEVVLQSPQHCFLESPPGLCSFLLEESNRQALARVYNMTRANEVDQRYLARQVEELAASCIDRHLHLIVDPADNEDRIRYTKREVANAVMSFRSSVSQQTDAQVSPEHEPSTTCIEKATAGDCDFYECFNKRFTCQPSHLLQFEAVSCRRLSESSRNKTEEKLIRRYQKCLMNFLLPLYNASSVSCSHLERETNSRRRQCLQDAGLCRATKVDWLIEGGTELGGFPVRMPVWYNMPRRSGGVFTLVQPYYFRHVSIFRGQIADVQCRCRANSAGLCLPKYRSTFTDGNKQIVEVSKGTRRMDEDCRDAGGTCQEDRHSCNGTYAADLCIGSASWRCCLPNGNDEPCERAKGICMLTKYSDRCDDSSGTLRPTLCAGSTKRQCCVPNRNNVG